MYKIAWIVLCIAYMYIAISSLKVSSQLGYGLILFAIGTAVLLYR